MIGRFYSSPRLLGRGLCLLFASTLGACAYIPEEDVDWRLDPDGDGLVGSDDCDPADADVGGPTTYFTDADGDGYGDAASPVEACTQPAGSSRLDSDCNDAEASAYPGSDEVWYDGIDQDCDGNDSDQDGDGFDAEEVGGDDCDDTQSNIYPSSADNEIWYDGIDQNCDGADDYDQDGDGYTVDTDCDDTDPDRYPDSGATPEVYYNGQDDNCDLTDGDGDADGDGFWSEDYEILVLENGFGPMAIPAGAEGDCWDAEDDSGRTAAFTAINGGTDLQPGEIYPGAVDVFYDGVDADCAGLDADGDGAEDDFDADHDTYVSASVPNRAGAYGEDCDDNDGSINPGEIESWYDGVDSDCAGDDDFDADSDGYTSTDYGGGDCDDGEKGINPDATEVCNDGIDDNCDGDDNGCTPEGRLSLTTTATSQVDGVTGDALGFSIGSGDFNGDGDVDLVGGAWRHLDSAGTYVGAAYVWHGPVSGSLDTSDAALEFTGTSTVTYLGYGDVLLEDVDGDGYDDLLAGANAGSAGAVALLFGPVTGAVDADSADLLVSGAGSDYAYKISIGDLDDDGKLDLAIGGRNNSDLFSRGGVVGVVSDVASESGSMSLSDSSYLLYGPTSYSYLGQSLGPMGDFDGDGVDDLAIGTSSNSSTAQALGTYVVQGPLTTSDFVDSVGFLLKEENVGDSGGYSLAGGEDLDGDGYDDLLVGAPLYDAVSNEGRVYLIKGPMTGSVSLAGAAAIFEGASSSDYLGLSLTLPGDLDGDGVQDLAFGSYTMSIYSSTDGGAYLALGPHSGSQIVSSAQAVWYGGSAGDQAGYGLAPAGDANADGYDDLFIGAPGVDSGGTSAGAIYLLNGGGY